MSKETVLSQKSRKFLQIAIVILLVGFLLAWFLLKSKQKPEQGSQNKEVYIQDSIVHVFGDEHSLADYPNRISIHYPYLLVIKPTETSTHIYNLNTSQKEKVLNEAVLDYDGSSILKNDGKTSWFNNKNLGILCEKGFIKSNQEVLCLTKVESDWIENKLVSLNINTNELKELYVSNNLITDFTFINDKIYFGEIDLYTKQNYLLIDGDKMDAPSVVSLIYGTEVPRILTLKGALSDKDIKYQLINSKIEQIEEGQIHLK